MFVGYDDWGDNVHISFHAFYPGFDRSKLLKERDKWKCRSFHGLGHRQSLTLKESIRGLNRDIQERVCSVKVFARIHVLFHSLSISFSILNLSRGLKETMRMHLNKMVSAEKERTYFWFNRVFVSFNSARNWESNSSMEWNKNTDE